MNRVLEYGERFGNLTVLRQERRRDRSGVLYRVGCVCGRSGTMVTAGALLGGRKTECKRCSSASVANTSEKS